MTDAPPRERLLVIGAVVVAVLSWASAFLVIRAVANDFDPGALTLGRLAVAALALGAVQLVRGAWVPPTRREWLLLGVFGVSWFLIYNLALNAAEHELDPGTAALLVNVAPLIVALVAGTLLGEGFPRWLIIGAIVAFGGIALIGVATASGALSVVGVVLALVAAVTYAIAVLVQKPLLQRLPGLQVTLIGVAIGVAGSLPWSGSLITQLAVAPPAATAGLVYLGLVPTAVAFLAWAYALRRMPAGKLTTTTYLVPVIATVAAWPLLGEVPPPLALLGGLLCLAGVALTRLPTGVRTRDAAS
ncbi:DMT family transporter [Agrococcus sp. ARC_14]|uniref:DMT family transporter n=1 Tax=Agrococcus sp. ARC_14 TaxID=2919927 RepID=UPI001F06E508|nr:DMT family transporter [Agrococcus sp. ARC_14]MCH1882506.1 DMT family transporter [Agrococcus sp. ARC_14]